MKRPECKNVVFKILGVSSRDPPATMHSRFSSNQGESDGIGQVLYLMYRIDVIWTPLSNRTPPKANSNTTPVKNPVLGHKLLKIAQIVAKFELNPTQKSILKNRTPEL